MNIRRVLGLSEEILVDGERHTHQPEATAQNWSLPAPINAVANLEPRAFSSANGCILVSNPENFRLHPGRQPLQSTSLFMAKTCWIEREKRRTALAAKYADVRAKMKKEGDYVGLSLLPRDASPSRQSRRCQMTGRKRAFIGRFKLSRIAFRELASQGLIPGVTKSSW